jgi:hypothetical protein
MYFLNTLKFVTDFWIGVEAEADGLKKMYLIIVVAFIHHSINKDNWRKD